jgi:hypothetical protein
MHTRLELKSVRQKLPIIVRAECRVKCPSTVDVFIETRVYVVKLVAKLKKRKEF